MIYFKLKSQSHLNPQNPNRHKVYLKYKDEEDYKNSVKNYLGSISQNQMPEILSKQRNVGREPKTIITKMPGKHP